MFYEQPPLSVMAVIAVIGLTLSALAIIIGRRRGLLRYPAFAGDGTALGKQGPIKIGRLLGLVMFSLAGIIVGMLLAILTAALFHVHPATFLGAWQSEGFSTELGVTLSLEVLGVLLLCQVWYCHLLGESVWQWLWGGKEGVQHWGQQIFVGLKTLFVAWPVTMTVTTVVGLATVAVLGPFPDLQLPILLFQSALNNPLLAALLAIEIVLIGPVLEELFFRGFLQSWLRRHLDRWSAIFIAAFVFSSVHFRIQQGLANIQLLPAILVLGCFLGYLFERQRNLWASIALHALFNATTVALLVLGSLFAPH